MDFNKGVWINTIYDGGESQTTHFNLPCGEGKSVTVFWDDNTRQLPIGTKLIIVMPHPKNTHTIFDNRTITTPTQQTINNEN